MAIKAPHSHLYHSIKLEVTNSKLGGGGRKSLYQALNLVAYIDMMTILVIFLLMTFSASGEILFVQKNIVLPDAQNWSDLERAPVIGVTKDVVTLDGRQVATGEELMKDSATGDAKIPELADQLVTAKNNYKLLHPTEDFKGVCIIQSDKSVEFKMLRKVMFSAATAGYQNVNFAVRPKAKGGAAAPAAAE
jgi:biopolymer transport protein ExbD